MSEQQGSELANKIEGKMGKYSFRSLSETSKHEIKAHLYFCLFIFVLTYVILKLLPYLSVINFFYNGVTYNIANFVVLGFWLYIPYHLWFAFKIYYDHITKAKMKKD